MIFLDSGDTSSILKYYNMGIIRGVTCNPTILKRDGVTKEMIKDRMEYIADTIKPYPLSVEVTTNTPLDMLVQAREMALWAYHKNINIKIPIHGPNNEDNLSIIKQLASEGISINATAMMNAQQCVLAAMAGADYVSLFGGRVNDMGYNCIGEIKKLRYILDNLFDSPPKIIMGSAREPLNVIEWLSVGADIITVPPSILDKMIVHPYTRDTVYQFLTDAKGVDIEKKS